MNKVPSQLIQVHTLSVEQPAELDNSLVQWIYHEELSEFVDVMSAPYKGYGLCIIPIVKENYFDEIYMAIKCRNYGFTVIVCIHNIFPYEMYKDIIAFIQKCAVDEAEVRTEVLLDENALEIVDNNILSDIVKEFEKKELP
jgi:hypothetical protein